MRYTAPAALCAARFPVTIRPLGVCGARPLAAFLCRLLIRSPMLFQNSLQLPIERLEVFRLPWAPDLEDGISAALVW